MKVELISRAEIFLADMLVRMAVESDPKLPKSTLVKIKTSSSIEQEVKVMSVTRRGTWMDMIIYYFIVGIIPFDKKQARKLKC